MPKKELKTIDVAHGFQELEEMTAWFEKGEADLDQGLEKFERAMVIAEQLKERLMQAENKIKDLKQKFHLPE